MDASTRDQYSSYWGRAYVDYNRRLFDCARRLTNGRIHDAEDLVQETIIRVLTYPKNPVEVRNPLSYFKSVMRNAWITKWVKENTAHMDSLDQIAGDPARQKDLPRVEPEVLRTARNEELREELRIKQGRLSTEEKSLLNSLRRGKSIEEVAADCGEDPCRTLKRYYALVAKLRYRVRCGQSKAKGSGRP